MCGDSSGRAVGQCIRATHEVVSCSDGAQAVEYYRESWERIDLVILDLVMPVLSGGETFSQMRQINPNVKVILSSGYSIDGQAHEILNEGALSFIQKPFKLDELSRKVAEGLKK